MRMADLKVEKMVEDRQASLKDIEVCEQALRVGITRYSTGDVRERLEVNQKIVGRIDAELLRRGV